MIVLVTPIFAVDVEIDRRAVLEAFDASLVNIDVGKEKGKKKKEKKRKGVKAQLQALSSDPLSPTRGKGKSMTGVTSQTHFCCR